MLRGIRKLVLALAVGSVSLPAVAEIWDSGGADSNWSTGLNWDTNIVPANNGTANLFFGGGAKTSPVVNVPFDVNSITFSSGSPAFSLSGSTLTVRGGGITNQSSNLQSFSNSISINAPAESWLANAGNLQMTSGVGVGAGSVLTVGGSFNTLLSGQITGGGGITTTGSGTLTIGNGAADAVANTITGPITVSGGSIILDKAAGTLASAGDLIANGGTITANRAGQISTSSNVTLNSGSINFGQNTTIGSLTTVVGGYTASSALTLNSSAPYALTVSFGSLPAFNFTSGSGGGINLASGGGSVTLGTINLGNIVRTVTVADNVSGDDLTISGAITNGGILKNGPGTLTLTGANSFGSVVNIAAGAVHISADTALGGGFVQFSGGTLISSGITSSKPLQFNGAGTIDTAGTDSTYSAIISGVGAFNKIGAGTLTLGGGAADLSPNNVIGTLTHSAGTLVLDKGPGTVAWPRDMLVNGSGTLVVNRANELSNFSNLTFGSSGACFLAPGTSLGTFTITSGSAASGSLVLNSNAQYAYNIGAGLALPFGVTLAGPSGGGINLLANHALQTTQSGPIDLGNKSRAIDTSNNVPDDDLIITGVISNGAIIKGGFGSLALLGANTYSGGTTINSGLVRIAADNGLGAAGSPITVNSTATLQTSGSFNFTHPLNNNFGTLSQDSGTTITVTAPISGQWLNKTGPGTLVLAAANSFNGYTSVTGGSLAIGNDQALGSSVLYMTGGGEVHADGTARVLANGLEIDQDDHAIFGGSLDLTLNGPVTIYNANHTITVKNRTTFGGAIGPSGLGKGFTKDGTGTLVLSGNNTINDTIKVNQGTLELAGGTLNAPIANYATFAYTAGTFGSSLANYGTVIFNSSTFTSNGLQNYASMNLSPGMTLTVNGAAGMQNNANLTLNNGILDGSADFTNNGVMNASGSLIGPKRFVNAGQLTATGVLSISISSPDAFLLNTGEIDTTPAGTINFFGSPLKNQGTINLNGGTVSSAQPLINDLGGTITGHGNVAADLGVSIGSIVVSDGTLRIANPFTNSGAVQIGGTAATLSGGFITNNGTIQGFGTVANTFSNTFGSVEAVGGTLIFSGAGSSNFALIAAATGNKLLFTKGLATNAGTISLTGGTFDNGNNAMSNTGQISGYGTFRFGTLTNNGSMTFTGGTSTINGNVTNAADKKVEVRYQSAIFTGTFTNNGIFKNTSAQVTFSGTYIENGKFLSDPADNFFGDVVIGSSGAWSGGVGDRFFVSGDLNNGSTAKTDWATAAAELDLIGGTVHHFLAGGSDLGSGTFDGYDNNFAWGRLVLGAGDSLVVNGEALYVGVLDLKNGLPQIASISGDANLYYDLGNPANAYLQGQTYPLSGGGSITPVPEPLTLTLLFIPLFVRRRRSLRVGR